MEIKLTREILDTAILSAMRDDTDTDKFREVTDIVIGSASFDRLMSGHQAMLLDMGQTPFSIVLRHITLISLYYGIEAGKAMIMNSFVDNQK